MEFDFEIINSLNSNEISGELVRLGDENREYLDKIIVARDVTPMDSPYLINAKAIIVKEAGLLNHVSIFCRELGMTLIKADVYDYVKSGQQIRINLEKKTLFLMD